MEPSKESEFESSKESDTEGDIGKSGTLADIPTVSSLQEHMLGDLGDHEVLEILRKRICMKDEAEELTHDDVAKDLICCPRAIRRQSRRRAKTACTRRPMWLMDSGAKVALQRVDGHRYT